MASIPLSEETRKILEMRRKDRESKTVTQIVEEMKTESHQQKAKFVDDLILSRREFFKNIFGR